MSPPNQEDVEQLARSRPAMCGRGSGNAAGAAERGGGAGRRDDEGADTGLLHDKPDRSVVRLLVDHEKQAVKLNTAPKRIAMIQFGTMSQPHIRGSAEFEVYIQHDLATTNTRTCPWVDICIAWHSGTRADHVNTFPIPSALLFLQVTNRDLMVQTDAIGTRSPAPAGCLDPRLGVSNKVLHTIYTPRTRALLLPLPLPLLTHHPSPITPTTRPLGGSLQDV